MVEVRVSAFRNTPSKSTPYDLRASMVREPMGAGHVQSLRFSFADAMVVAWPIESHQIRELARQLMVAADGLDRDAEMMQARRVQ